MQSEINLIFDLFNKIGRDIAGRKVVFTWDNWGLAMPEATSILQELDDAIVKGSAESRERALWHATDLLIAGRYSDNDIWIFGEAIGRLAEEIEVVARARLAKRLAHSSNAPTNVIRRLAFDDSIAVAGPVLRHSEQLDSKTSDCQYPMQGRGPSSGYLEAESIGRKRYGRTCDARQQRGSELSRDK